MHDNRWASSWFSVPLRVIVNESTHTALGLPFGVTLLQSAEHGPYLPVFTNENLARTAIAAMGLSGSVAGQEPLRKYLDHFKQTGGEHVGLDATHPTRVGTWFCHVDTVLAGLAQSGA
jgi:hypothetical protein